MQDSHAIQNLKKALDAGDIEAARDILTEMWTASPDNPFINADLGTTHFALGDKKKALAHYRTAYAHMPDDVGLLDRIAQCHGDLRAWPEAIDYSIRVLLAAPTTAAATRLANVLFEGGRQSDAEALFYRHANAAEPALLMCFGQIFMQLDQPEKALAAYDLCAERQPWRLIANTAAPPSWMVNSPYSANRPSPRYGQLIEQYKLLHQAAEAKKASSSRMFEGVVGFSIVAPYVRRFRAKLGAASMLDYGGGRGAQYRLGAIKIGETEYRSSLEYLGLREAVCFDPAVAESDGSKASFDLVICIDALEHCDRLDLPWIVRGLFERARLGVFANIASYPARKILPNGENAHCTVEDASWWMEVFAAAAADFPAIDYQVIVSKDLQQQDRVVFGRADLGN